jgi:hypothetical protein
MEIEDILLCRYGHFSGINRKVQMKYQPKGRPRGSSSDDGKGSSIERFIFTAGVAAATATTTTTTTTTTTATTTTTNITTTTTITTTECNISCGGILTTVYYSKQNFSTMQ